MIAVLRSWWNTFVQWVAAVVAWLLAPLRLLLDRWYMAEHARILAALDPQEIALGQARINAMIPPLSVMLALLLLKADGTVWNHIGWIVGGAPDPIGLVEVTIQRVNGLSPIDMREQAMAEAAQLRDMLRYLTDAIATERHVMNTHILHEGPTTERLVRLARSELAGAELAARELLSER